MTEIWEGSQGSMIFPFGRWAAGGRRLAGRTGESSTAGQGTPVDKEQHNELDPSGLAAVEQLTEQQLPSLDTGSGMLLLLGRMNLKLLLLLLLLLDLLDRLVHLLQRPFSFYSFAKWRRHVRDSEFSIFWRKSCRARLPRAPVSNDLNSEHQRNDIRGTRLRQSKKSFDGRGWWWWWDRSVWWSGRPGKCRRRRYEATGTAQEILSASTLIMWLLLDAALHKLFQSQIGECWECD